MEMCVVVIESRDYKMGHSHQVSVEKLKMVRHRSQIGAVLAALWPCRTWATLRFFESLPGPVGVL